MFLGDYVDRGEESADVLRELMQLEQASDQVTCLRGNHEEMLLRFLEQPELHGPFWPPHRARQTLASYGIAPVYPEAPEDDWIVAGDALRDRMGEAQINWLSALPALWRSGNVVAVHAGADPDLPIEQQDEEVLIWGHRDFLRRPRRDGIWIVHGHTIMEQVICAQGRVSIDTGAYATGRLSAVHVTQGKLESFTA